MTLDTHTPKLVATAAGEGEALWWFGALAEVKLATEQLTIIEITEAPDVTAPLHVHHREDEGFWILEGSATLEIGDATIEARAGDFAWGPRGVPHRFTTGPDGCRLLFILTPGGFERLVREMGVPAERRTLPPLIDEEPDMARIAAIAEKYGGELLG